MKPGETGEFEEDAIERLRFSKKVFLAYQRKLAEDVGAYWVVHTAEYEDLVLIERMRDPANAGQPWATRPLQTIPFGFDRVDLSTLLRQEVADSHLSEVEFFDRFLKGALELWAEIRDAVNAKHWTYPGAYGPTREDDHDDGPCGEPRRAADRDEEVQ